ncbi:MAG: DUF3368 domain-containing protein [Candidatus Nanohaloarchaea archaeon]|nr:DUF3368 domain-containing protein [Candidatus Nanohaloarchaea archaeon]
MYLAKADILEHVGELEEEILVPEKVYKEVVIQGKEEGYADAYRIEDFLDNSGGKMTDSRNNEIFDELKNNPNLSKADVEVLAIAEERSAIAVVDEDYARGIADVEGISNHGSVYVVLLLVKRDIISAEKAQEAIDSMVEHGWYCSTDLYAKVRSKLDELAGD